VSDQSKQQKKSERRKNHVVSKVKDLLRESNQNALNINTKDLDKMFNLELPSLQTSEMNEDGSTLVDRTSQEYYNKI
jgi:hypothetical protein